MRRVDQIKNMSAYEMADWMIGAGIDGDIDYCPNKKECVDYEEIYGDLPIGDLPIGGCRQCLIEWLKEDGEL